VRGRLYVSLTLFLLILGLASSVAAQSTTGTISGRVNDPQNLALPGVTVTVQSPNLQGVREAVTSETGDYLVALLPPGTYTVKFELSGFESQQKTVTVAPTQAAPVDAILGVAGVQETVVVTARAADVLTKTAQVATNFSSELLSSLPTGRDVNAAMLLAPSVHSSGPSGNFSIAGSMSFESLFMVNGVSINENIRGTPYTLYIEDAIQETTIATAGISAEYGRFGGGVVNIITKSGGNRFSGSFRDTLNNDDWRSLVPSRTGDAFTSDTKTDKVVPTYEYTVGGPIMRDRLWFFTAGRVLTQEFSRSGARTNIPYVATNKTRRFEGNATYSVNPNHRVQGTYIKENLDEVNGTFNPATSMDVRSLYNRSTPNDILTLSYSGVLTPSLFLEGRYSRRNFTFIGSGAPTTDLIEGTLLLDAQRGNTRFWSPTFCGVCTVEERDNEDYFVKGSYFLSRSGVGSHTLVFGYDNFDDIRSANNHQSGSDYRIFATTSIIQGGDVTPVFRGDGTTIIQWNPIRVDSQGSDFRTHSFFVNDSWRMTDRLTANLGLRYQKNDGKNQAGLTVITDGSFSPRFGLIWNPTGRDDWSVTGSFARYIAGVANAIADASSVAGQAEEWQYLYRGPNVNAGGAVTTPTADAIRQVFAWFETASGCRPQDSSCQPNLATNGSPFIPGVAVRIGDSLKTPSSYEYAVGVSRQFGSRATLRADYTYRDYADFYAARTDLTTGKVTNSVGRTFDVTLIENDNDGIYKRRYQGLTGQATYRIAERTNVGGTYTLSHAWGNFDGETVNNGPVPASALSSTGAFIGAYSYPEYVQESWNYPEGDLAIDQRHRARLWINYGVPKLEGLTLSLLEALESGIPYGAGGIPIQGGNPNGINAAAYVTNPGYANPPAGSSVAYYYTARDAFRTEGQQRTDFAANYVYNVGSGDHRVNLFVQAQVINLFNQFQLCACGAVSVFNNPGQPGAGAGLQSIDRSIRTPVNAPASFQSFNPFTTTPVEGVNWAKGANFGHALTRFAYTTPRTFRLTFGVRF
jgi:outer membrane receptor for ferrienterochelin and colicin